MKKFLSIGEVSKIKNVSPKSLRYYERLGILIPAYVNQETGYRYYTVEQLLILDLILICIELNIPLKNFKNYITDQHNIDIHALLIEGEQIINQKIRALEKTRHFLSNLSEHVVRTNHVKNLNAPFLENFPKRYFLTLTCENDLSDYKSINAQYSKLIRQAINLEIPDKFNQGFLKIRKDGTYEKKIFLEIPDPHMDLDNLEVIDSGKFLCRLLCFQEFEDIQTDSKFLIIMESFDLTMDPLERLIEIQEAVI